MIRPGVYLPGSPGKHCFDGSQFKEGLLGIKLYSTCSIDERRNGYVSNVIIQPRVQLYLLHVVLFPRYPSPMIRCIAALASPPRQTCIHATSRVEAERANVDNGMTRV